jgi:hypothetical protein
MKLELRWALAATLCIATSSIVALSGSAQASQPGLDSATAASIQAVTSPVGLRNDALSHRGTWAPAAIRFGDSPAETMAQCMGYWDSGTHMSKAEWHRACQRTQDGTRF